MSREKESFEEQMKRLQKIVEELSNGRLTLGEALKKYEEGIKLASICSGALNEAQRKVELLMQKGNKYALEKFDDKTLKEEV